MPSRSVRVLASAAVAALAPFVVAVVSAAPAAGVVAHARAGDALLTRCAKVALGAGRAPATPVAGSADPGVIASLGVFRRTRSPADRLPAATQLRRALAFAGAMSYDPSTAVRVGGGRTQPSVYAVPAAMSLPALPARCSALRQFPVLSAYVGLRTQEAGSGPGVCLVWTELIETGQPDVLLPGAPASKPARTPVVTGTACESEAVLSGYLGALGDGVGHPQLALIPDGISAITYTLADGRQLTVPVAGNLAAPPAALSMRGPLRHPTAARLRRRVAAQLPTTVTETGTGTVPPVTLSRPVSLIPDTVATFSLLRGLARSASGGTSGGGTSISTSGAGASCSARTHRCVAVTVTTACDSHERCRMSRTIHRYRYVGARPPAGTTGPDTQPTAPIVARVNRLVHRPAKLVLVLGGPPQRNVVVLEAVSCLARNSAASGGGPALRVPVPSRTPIALPGRARTFSACEVSALVISSQRGPVRATVARG